MIEAKRPTRLKRVKKHIRHMLNMSDDELTKHMKQKYNCSASRNNLIKYFNIKI